VPRDAYNVVIMTASPGYYCEFYGRASSGRPASASYTANGAGKELFTDVNGAVRMGTTWDTLASGDQGAIYVSASLGPYDARPLGKVNVTRDEGKWKVESGADTCDPNYGEGLDSYGGGTYTIPGSSQVPGGRNDVGGSFHLCMGIYQPAVADVVGLSPAQVSAVMGYNQC